MERGGGIEIRWRGKPGAAAVLTSVATRRGALKTDSTVGDGEAPDAFRQRLIRGENLDVLACLLSEFTAAVDLIYIDPPFSTSRTFSSTDGTFAYADRWKTNDEYLSFLYARFVVAKELLAPNGTLCVHVDYRASHYARLILDELYGSIRFRNEVIWSYQSGGRARSAYAHKHDTLLFYSKGPKPYFDADAVSITRGSERRNHMKRGVDDAGRAFSAIKSNGKVYRYYDDATRTPADVWDDISHLQQKDPERTGYPTQKPERLLERIVSGACPTDGLVLDFFCGSGTTAAVAERLGRRWIACDVGDIAIATTLKRVTALRNSRAGGAGRWAIDVQSVT